MRHTPLAPFTLVVVGPVIAIVIVLATEGCRHRFLHGRSCKPFSASCSIGFIYNSGSSASNSDSGSIFVVLEALFH